jgi:S1-C subfamily serine protease
MPPRILIPALAAMAVAALLSDGYVGRRLIERSRAHTTATEGPAVRRAAQLPIAHLSHFSQLVERDGPAVVNIPIDETMPASSRAT